MDSAPRRLGKGLLGARLATENQPPFHVKLRNRLPSGALVGLLFAQLLAFGAVSSFLAGFFAYAEIIVSVAVIALIPEEETVEFWAGIGPAALLFLAALAWAAAPLALAVFMPERSNLLTPDATRLEFLKLAGLGGMGLAGGLIGFSRARIQAFMFYLVSAGLVYTLFALWMWRQSPLTVWGQTKGAHTFRFTGTLLNANAGGCLFGMIGLLSLGYLHSVTKRFDLRTATFAQYLRLSLTACTIIASLGACVLTQSRAALFLCALFGAGIVGFEARRARASRFGLVAAAVILCAGLGLGAGQVASRWDSLIADAQLRGAAYAHYFGAVVRAPWLGCGLGCFRTLHESMLTPGLAPSIWDFGAVHSAVIQAALEGGAPFLALLLAAAGLMAWRIIKAQSARIPMSAVFSGVIAAILLAFSLSFVDIALNVPAIAALSVVLLGMAWGGVSAGASRRQLALDA